MDWEGGKRRVLYMRKINRGVTYGRGKRYGTKERIKDTEEYKNTGGKFLIHVSEGGEKRRAC